MIESFKITPPEAGSFTLVFKPEGAFAFVSSVAMEKKEPNSTPAPSTTATVGTSPVPVPHSGDSSGNGASAFIGTVLLVVIGVCLFRRKPCSCGNGVCVHVHRRH